MAKQGLSKADYLKKYLDSDAKPRKKKRKTAPKALKSGLKIYDDDVDFSKVVQQDSDADIDNDQPTVAAVIDERPKELQQLEQFRQDKRWKTIARHDSDSDDEKGIPTVARMPKKTKAASKHPQQQSDSDPSPPRGRHSDSDASPPRAGQLDSDASPPRRRRSHDSEDVAASERNKSARHQNDKARRRNDKNMKNTSGLRKKDKIKSDSDASPPRLNGSDSDVSPPRANRYDSDASPPRSNTEDTNKAGRAVKRRHLGGRQSDSDQSLTRGANDASPPRRKSRFEPQKQGLNQAVKHDSGQNSKKTLSGAKAGLSKASDVKHELAILKSREEEMFKKLDDKVSGRNAKAVVRDKSRHNRKSSKEKELDKEKAKKKTEVDAKYEKWTKGLAQEVAAKEHLQEMIHEMNKPLARAKDDEDLDKMLREQEREEDPMLAFIRTKKKKQNQPDKPRYSGPQPPPNRYNIWPGYRWDGVDRSNGFEKKFLMQNANKKAVEEIAYKWSTEDM